MGPKPPKDIKVYDYESTDKWCNQSWCRGKFGFIRSQDKEVIAPDSSKADDMIGMTSDDFSRLLEACPKD